MTDHEHAFQYRIINTNVTSIHKRQKNQRPPFPKLSPISIKVSTHKSNTSLFQPPSSKPCHRSQRPASRSKRHPPPATKDHSSLETRVKRGVSQLVTFIWLARRDPGMRLTLHTMDSRTPRTSRRETVDQLPPELLRRLIRA